MVKINVKYHKPNKYHHYNKFSADMYIYDILIFILNLKACITKLCYIAVLIHIL